MDIISHSLYGGVIARKRSLALGLFFGALPDLIGMGGLFGWRAYLVAHSLLVAFLVACAARLWLGTWIYGGAYLFHLLVDVFTHSSGTRPAFYVPFLWRSVDPIGFHGWNWWGRGLIVEIAGAIIAVAAFCLVLRERYLIRRGTLRSTRETRVAWYCLLLTTPWCRGDDVRGR